MATIAFILLCHKDPDAIIQQAKQLTAVGDFIAIHFDAQSPKADFRRIHTALVGNPNVAFVKKRIRCGWGEWSLVQATLDAVETALEAFPSASHFYMVSGDCMAIKSAKYIHNFLDDNDVDYVESFDYFESDWIKTGWKKERLIYHHFFNERTQKRLFYWSFELQKCIGFSRNIPADLQVMIGSQWWVLRRNTIKSIIEFSKKRTDVIRFFRTTWIPDETFFQTLVRHLVPSDEIQSRSMTFLFFTDYGMPVTFYNDQYDLLLAQDSLFARKISYEATKLKIRLGNLFVSDRTEFDVSNNGYALFKFLSGHGRIGRRFTSRFWETKTSMGRERELLILVCKKWHVAKRLVDAIRCNTGIYAVEYLFNEQDASLPDLGGLQSTLDKRSRHRRAFMRILFDYYGTDRLIICLDTESLDLMKDFLGDKSTTKLLEIKCDMTDDYLAGHARRVNLVGDQTSDETLAQLLSMVRDDITSESDRIRGAEFENYHCIVEASSLQDNAYSISRFLSVNDETARKIAKTPNLFVD